MALPVTQLSMCQPAHRSAPTWMPSGSGPSPWVLASCLPHLLPHCRNQRVAANAELVLDAPLESFGGSPVLSATCAHLWPHDSAALHSSGLPPHPPPCLLSSPQELSIWGLAGQMPSRTCPEWTHEPRNMWFRCTHPRAGRAAGGHPEDPEPVTHKAKRPTRSQRHPRSIPNFGSGSRSSAFLGLRRPHRQKWPEVRHPYPMRKPGEAVIQEEQQTTLQ